MGPIHSKCDFLGNDASHFFYFMRYNHFYINLKHKMTNQQIRIQRLKLTFLTRMKIKKIFKFFYI